MTRTPALDPASLRSTEDTPLQPETGAVWSTPDLTRGVFYRSDAIWVSGLHRFGQACVAGTRFPVRQIVRNPASPEEYASWFDGDLPVESVVAVRAAWSDPRERARIERAEAKARHWAAGWWACNTREDA